MKLCVLIFLFVLVVRFFLSFSCFFFLFEVFLGLMYLCFVFDIVYDECRHVHLFFVLYMNCFE